MQNAGTVVNVAAFVGHKPVRIYVMGDDAMEREATGETTSRALFAPCAICLTLSIAHDTVCTRSALSGGMSRR